LLAIYEAIFGEPVLPHPRCIARVVLPHREAAPTPPHQDFIHIQGTRRFWTCWFPLGDCPTNLGGVVVLKGSHRGGIRGYSAAQGAGNVAAEVCPGELTWVGGNFESGDLLTFPSMTVHKALRNEYPEQIRLSCDNRYQAVSQPVEKKSLEPHGRVLPWEEVYRDWKSTDLHYYWKKMDLVLSDWDDSIRWQKERICD
jgi:ectoine hydroxylase-related dioxygenase (phytanoyl-CoA dioxygenase family)